MSISTRARNVHVCRRCHLGGLVDIDSATRQHLGFSSAEVVVDLHLHHAPTCVVLHVEVIGSSQIVLGVGCAILHVVFHTILHRRECGVNLLVLGVVGDALPLSKLGGTSKIACQTFTELLARKQITIDHS